MSRDGFSPVTVNKTQFFLDDDLAILLPPPTIQLVQAAPAQRSAESSPSLKPTIPTSPEYTENDFAANCENQYYRYIPNSEKISHLLLKRESNEAYQFSIPHPTGVPEVPAIEPLTESIYGYTLPNENHAFQGRTASGEIMISRRHYNLSIQNGNDDPIEYTFFPLSPKKNLAGFYGPTFVNRFVETEAAKSAVKKILESDAITGSKQSGELEIVNKDIPIRAEIKTRKPDQNTVMGKKSAAVAYGEFLEKYKPILTEDLQKILHDSSTT
ncbi:MAG: hypothetical protein NTZ67_04965, partial [Gammaproteobacteria bacterium]|nr:hypothetical protein [Gammaproteobacteria bacterium]